jgi:hypothetical protein
MEKRLAVVLILVATIGSFNLQAGEDNPKLH